MKNSFILRNIMGFIDFLIIFWYILKIEKRKINNRILVIGLFFSLGLLYLQFFLEWVFEVYFPVAFYLLLPIVILIGITAVLFNIFNNSLKKAFVKSLIIFVTMNLFSLTALPLVYLIGLVKPYDQFPLYLSFVVQGWTIIILLFFERFSKYIDQGIAFMEKYFSVAVLISCSILVFFLGPKLALRYLVVGSNGLIIWILGITILVGLFDYMIYKYFLKQNIEKEKEIEKKKYTDL